jgi:hypothetical protein
VRIQVWIAIAVHVLVALNSIPFCFARHNCFRRRCAHPLGHARGRGTHNLPWQRARTHPSCESVSG